MRHVLGLLAAAEQSRGEPEDRLLVTVDKHAKLVRVTNEELAARIKAIVGAEAAVALFGRPRFQKLTNELTNALGSENEDESIRLLKRFTRLAKKDIASTE